MKPSTCPKGFFTRPNDIEIDKTKHEYTQGDKCFRIKKDDLVNEQTSCPSGFFKVPENATKDETKYEYTEDGKCRKLKPNASKCQAPYKETPSNHTFNVNKYDYQADSTGKSKGCYKEKYEALQLPSWVESNKSCFSQYDTKWEKNSTGDIISKEFGRQLKLSEGGTAEGEIAFVTLKGFWRCLNGNLEVYLDTGVGSNWIRFKDKKWDNIKKTDLPPNIENTTDLPEWAKDKKSCLSFFTDLKKEGDNVSGIRLKGDVDEYKVLMSNDGSMTLTNAKSGKVYKGKWDCNNDKKIVLVTCEDSDVLKWNGTKFEWKTDENLAKTMGCSSSSSSNNQPSPQKPKWDTDCADKDSFKKGCKDGQIKKLQGCLNKNEKSTLPDLVTDGKWGKKTQAKLEEKFPELKDGVTQDKIDEICKTITEPKKDEVKPVEEPKKPEDIIVKVRESLMKELRKKIIKENPDEKPKPNVKIEGNLSFLSDDDFFNLARDTYQCLPTAPNKGWWLDMPKKSTVREKPALVGSSKNTGVQYAFYRDWTVENLSTGQTQKWFCEALKNYVPKQFRPTKVLEKFGVDSSIDDGDELLSAINRVNQIINGLGDSGYVSNDFMTWKKTIEKYYPNANTILYNEYIPNDPTELELNYKPVDLDKTYGFKGVIAYRPKTKSEKLAIGKALTGEDKNTCIGYLKTYLMNAISNAAGANDELMPKLEVYKASIVRCSNQGQFSDVSLKREEVLDPAYYGNLKRTPFDRYGGTLEWPEIVKYLKGDVSSKDYSGKFLKLPSVYSVTLKENAMRDKIKSTLSEMVLSKRKNSIQETVIRKRVEMLFENTTFKTRKQRREFVVDLVKEALYVESQSSSNKLIKEEFWDVLKGFFGNEGSESVFNSFKTRMGEWLTSHLSPKKADGWIGNCIRRTIQDVDMRDVHKITDCKFLTKRISDSIIEKLDEKMSNEELKDEGLYDVVRNGMADNVRSARFQDHIEQKVSNMICPILYDMSNKFDSTFDNMKKRAIGL